MSLAVPNMRGPFRLRKAYLKLHPRSSAKWDDAVALSGDARATAIHAIFKGARKGDFAQAVAELIVAGEDFVVPTYLGEAIREVVR